MKYVKLPNGGWAQINLAHIEYACTIENPGVIRLHFVDGMSIVVVEEDWVRISKEQVWM